MATLEDLRIECGWSKLELAREAKIDFNTLQKAITGETVSLNTAAKIARAITRQLERPVHFQDIEGLNVRT